MDVRFTLAEDEPALYLVMDDRFFCLYWDYDREKAAAFAVSCSRQEPGRKFYVFMQADELTARVESIAPAPHYRGPYARRC